MRSDWEKGLEEELGLDAASSWVGGELVGSGRGEASSAKAAGGREERRKAAAAVAVRGGRRRGRWSRFEMDRTGEDRAGREGLGVILGRSLEPTREEERRGWIVEAMEWKSLAKKTIELGRSKD